MTPPTIPNPAPTSAAPAPAPDERRKRNIPVALDRRDKTSDAPRKPPAAGPAVNHTDHSGPTSTSEYDHSADQIEFLKAVDRYKKDNRRPFPTWSEILEVLRSLGYRKVAEPVALPGRGSGRGPTVLPTPPAS